ncbi:MAG: hypothetical protein ACI93P_001936 [bacterium]|jgi:hypothetical protein
MHKDKESNRNLQLNFANISISCLLTIKLVLGINNLLQLVNFENSFCTNFINYTSFYVKSELFLYKKYKHHPLGFLKMILLHKAYLLLL